MTFMQIQLIAENFKQWTNRHEKCFIKILISIPAMCAYEYRRGGSGDNKSHRGKCFYLAGKPEAHVSRSRAGNHGNDSHIRCHSTLDAEASNDLFLPM